MSSSMRETVKTLAVHQRLKRSIAKLEQVHPDSDLISEYRALSARIMRDLHLFRAHAELALRRARSKAECKAAEEFLHLVVITESDFATGVERAN